MTLSLALSLAFARLGLHAIACRTSCTLDVPTVSADRADVADHIGNDVCGRDGVGILHGHQGPYGIVIDRLGRENALVEKIGYFLEVIWLFAY